MPDRELPSHPNLEQYKKQAKDLVKDRARAVPEASARIQRHHPRLRNLPEFDIPSAPFKLSDAQLVIAREHAFESWSKFATHVQTLPIVQPVVTLKDALGPNQFEGCIRVDGIELAAKIAIPTAPTGVVLLAHASGSARYNPRNQYVADAFNRGALGTILTDLLTEDEELTDMETDELRFDIRLLGRRIAAITDWIGHHPTLKDLGLGYFGAGTGAAAVLFAAAERPGLVRVVVSSGGRPDLAGPWLWKVQAPTLFIVGGKETATLAFNHSAMTWFPRQTVRELEIIDGAGHLFEEPSALEASTSLARDWFCRYLPS